MTTALASTVPVSLRRLALVAAAVVAAAASGCGDSTSHGDGNDPASAIPQSASVYLEAALGSPDQRRTTLATLRTILPPGSAGEKLEELIDRSGATKAAIAITGATAGKPDWVAVLKPSDDATARQALDTEPGYTIRRSYEGSDYRVNAQGAAKGVVSHFAINGTETAFKQVVRLLKKGGPSLASNADLQDARDKVGGQPGFMFVDLPALLHSAVGSAGSALGPSQMSAVDDVFKRLRAFGVGIGADAQAIRLHVVTLGEGAGTASGPGSALPLDQAPGGSWLALTQSDIAKSIQGVLGSLKTGSTGDLITQLETATGLNVSDDLLSWMGDAALFVEGDSGPALGGALTIQSTDPARTRTAIAKIKGLLRQLNSRLGPPPAGASAGFRMGLGDGGEKQLLIGLAGSRFVIAYGEKAFRDAVHPSSTLSSSATFKGASGLLDGSAKPTFYLDVQRLTRFIGLLAGSDQDFAKAKPYLDAFTAAIGGGSGDRRAEIAIGLK